MKKSCKNSANREAIRSTRARVYLESRNHEHASAITRGTGIRNANHAVHWANGERTGGETVPITRASRSRLLPGERRAVADGSSDAVCGATPAPPLPRLHSITGPCRGDSALVRLLYRCIYSDRRSARAQEARAEKRAVCGNHVTRARHFAGRPSRSRVRNHGDCERIDRAPAPAASDVNDAQTDTDSL